MKIRIKLEKLAQVIFHVDMIFSLALAIYVMYGAKTSLLINMRGIYQVPLLRGVTSISKIRVK